MVTRMSMVDFRKATKMKRSAKKAKLPSKGKIAADAVIAWCKKRGYPMPQPEREFAWPDRKWRFDLSWDFHYLTRPGGGERVRVMLALEINGGGWQNGRHNRGSSLEAEYAKLSHAAMMGWRVAIMTYAMIERGELWAILDSVFSGIADRQPCA